jgi:anti-anti-sigma factor
VDHAGQDNFSATVEMAGHRAVVQVAGEVDLSVADRMYRAATADGAKAATLDLTAVTFFDSSGIQTLVRLAEHYPDALTVVPSPQVRRVLDISGLGGQPWLRTRDDSAAGTT